MAIKEALLVISAILAVAAAYHCNYRPTYTTSVGGSTYTLKSCRKSNQYCIDGLPLESCNPAFTNQCYNVYWYTGSICWSSSICQNAFSSGHCYKSGNRPSCKDVWVQDFGIEQHEDTVEGVKICETDANGVEHCRTLSEGARVMQEADCFCVKDSAGHKVCEPDNCDAGREAPPEF